MPARLRRQVGSRSADTRDTILHAALELFGTRGFEGASMHQIAARAGVHTPQLSYHFGDKRGLWQAAITSLLEELDRRIAEVVDPRDREGTVRALIRVFVRFAADHPELNRMVVWESAGESDRLTWLVQAHTRPRYAFLTSLVAPLQRQGIMAKIPLVSLYYLLIGGASLPFVAAPEARALSGREPATPAFIEAHTAALESLLFR